MKFIIYSMVYLGSALMVLNIYRYVRYAGRLEARKKWGKEAWILYVPIALLISFLLGYLGIGLFGKPDLLVSGILFGGSIFVFVIFLLLQRITDRIQQSEHLEAELMAAEESSRNKSRFLSSVSHEMRTPMNAIMGLNTLALKDPDLKPQTRLQLERIGANARHLLGLIDNILTLDDLGTGKISLEEKPFSLRSLLDRVNELAGEHCAAKGLEYSAQEEGDMALPCLGDEDKLEQVLLRLLDNAAKFTPAPGAVSLSARRESAGEGRSRLSFTVSDTGIGMDKDYLPRLFDAFSREDERNTGRSDGPGLGLTMTKHLVDLAGGDIQVESEKGKGSRFTVSLTVTDAPAAEPEAEEALRDPGQVLHGKHVLIAEDIDLNAEILMDLLDLEEVSAERAENGRKAVEVFAASAPGDFDAVLMDLRMPEMDGFEATRAIRALDRPDAASVPILAVTANTSREDERQARAAGMDDHLPKPLDADELYARLAKFIAHGRNEADRK